VSATKRGLRFTFGVPICDSWPRNIITIMTLPGHRWSVPRVMR
jgi:hypothetical protein